MAKKLTERQVLNIRALRKAGLGYDAIRRQTGHSIPTIKKHLGEHSELRSFKFVVTHHFPDAVVEAIDLCDAKAKFREKVQCAKISQIWVRVE